MHLLRALRLPTVALLWAGLATSSIGDQLFSVVLNWIAVERFGTAAGYLAALQAGATLATALLAGHWADRLEHRRLMILADLVRAAMLLVLVCVWIAQGQPPAWSLIACVLVLAAGQALFRPALQATLPALVDDISLLPAANALLDTTERIARLLGPGVVGVASSLLPLVHFVTLDAVTFIVSAATILGIIVLRPQAAPAARGGGSVLESIGRGFVAARRHKVLGFMCSATAVINGA